MISRIAEQCFWLGRYLERADSTARMLGAARALQLDADLPEADCWRPVVIVAGEEAAFVQRFGASAMADGEQVERYLCWDNEAPVSLIRSVAAARWNARNIREAVSLEFWEVINELHLWLGGPEAAAQYASHRQGFYGGVSRALQLALGLTQSTMLHDDPLRFIWLGVLLERAGQTARTLDVHHPDLSQGPKRHPVIEAALWLSLVRACWGFESFMKRHRGRVSASTVAAFLLFEPRFPRSIRHSVHAAQEHLCAIRPPDAAELPGAGPVARLVALDAWLEDLARQADELPDRVDLAALHAQLTHVVAETALICDGLGAELFLRTDPRAQAAASDAPATPSPSDPGEAARTPSGAGHQAQRSGAISPTTSGADGADA